MNGEASFSFPMAGGTDLGFTRDRLNASRLQPACVSRGLAD